MIFAQSRLYLFVGLNALRALSIIALLLVFASSIFTLVHDVQGVNRFVAAGKTNASNSTSNDILVDHDYIDGTTVPNQPAGVFWAVLNRLLIIGQVLVLILSEIGWPAAFFDRFFPVLGKDFGVGALGIIQCLIGAAVLSHHVDDFSLVSGFFLFVIGCLNMFFGLIFRNSAKTKRSIMFWREGKKNVFPASIHFDGKSEASTFSSSRAGYGFGRQAEKAAAKNGYPIISAPIESLARYGKGSQV